MDREHGKSLQKFEDEELEALLDEDPRQIQKCLVLSLGGTPQAFQTVEKENR